MKRYLPVNLSLSGQPCLLIGGDACAHEKAKALFEAGAVITLVARKLSPALALWASERGLRVQARDWQLSDLDGHFLCLNCVDADPALSQAVFEAALERRCLVWSHDQAEQSNVAMPAVVKAGPLSITVFSGGSTPGISSAL